MKNKFVAWVVSGAGVACAVAGIACAQASSGGSVLSAFRSYRDVLPISIAVPTVIEVPFGDAAIERSGMLVVDSASGAPQPYFLKEGTFRETLISATGPVPMGGATDGDSGSYADFPLPETERGQADIVLSAPAPITASSLTIAVGDHVALPNTIRISARTGAGERIVLATGRMDGQTVYFPETTASVWRVSLTYGQPLRITDIRFPQRATVPKDGPAVRFLAQPGHSYGIYFNPDRYVAISAGEAGDLRSDRDVAIAQAGPIWENRAYVIADADQDGVPDIRDNCVSLANADQADTNDNGRGDACDDFDRDGVMNSADNCPNQPNAGQADADGDRIGDVCDGEESRVTEKYVWLPWAGMGVAALVLIALFGIMLHSLKKDGAVPPR